MLYTLDSKKKDTESILNEKMAIIITEDLGKCFGDQASDNKARIAAYLLYRIYFLGKTDDLSYENLLDNELDLKPELLKYVNANYNKMIWDALCERKKYYKKEDLYNAILADSSFYNYRDFAPTPESIIRLANSILDIQAGDVVSDICCGQGRYFQETLKKQSEVSFKAYDYDLECCLISSIKAELLKADVDVVRTNVFDLSNDSTVASHKIFANYPFGLRVNSFSPAGRYLREFMNKDSGVSIGTSSDWVFNALISELLNEGDKAVSIIATGSTWNTMDRSMRRYFVEHGYIETVISLPDRMFYNTRIPTTMIVMSKGNKTVRLVEASGIYQEGRRYNYFSDENIQTIVNSVKADSEISRSVTYEELSKKDFSFNLGRYINMDVEFKNGVAFESIIKSITRGAPCTARELDEMASSTPTGIQYLMLADIQDGMINQDLNYLSSIDSSLEKYCIQDRNLVISKNGYPYKIAIVELREGKKVLANGNLFIIEIDEAKADPYYVKAFLESNHGTEQLKKITVGSKIPSIGLASLKSIRIPLPALAVQHQIATLYNETQREVVVLQHRLNRAIEKRKHIADTYIDN